MRKKDQNPGRVNRSEGASLPAANTTGSAMSSPAGNDVYRSMVLAFRMSELQVGGGNRNVNNLQDEYGSEVPLHYALRNNWFDDVELVLALGANIGIVNDEKEV